MGTIIDFTPELVKGENPYTADIADLQAAGEGKVMIITVAADDTNSKGEVRVGPARRLISEAAKAAGHSARFRKEDVKEDGSVDLYVMLGAPRTRTVKPAEDTATTKAVK